MALENLLREMLPVLAALGFPATTGCGLGVPLRLVVFALISCVTHWPDGYSCVRAYYCAHDVVVAAAMEHFYLVRAVSLVEGSM